MQREIVYHRKDSVCALLPCRLLRRQVLAAGAPGRWAQGGGGYMSLEAPRVPGGVPGEEELGGLEAARGKQ